MNEDGESTTIDRGEDEDSDFEPSGMPGVAITAGDVEIFRLLSEYRFLRREHLCALTGRPPKRLHRRIYRLLDGGYIARIRLPQQKHIYALSKAAIPVLVEQGSASPEEISRRLRTHELKELFIKHEMLIVDIHAVLALATRQGPVRLVDWREGRELHDYVTIADYGGSVRLPVRPDAFFVLEDSRRPAGANRAHFFLEADRSTATQTRFQDKLKAYWHYLEQGLHTQKYSIKNFRMLTVTLTEERAKNLCGLAGAILPDRAGKYFFFTSSKLFSINAPAPILDSVFLSPRAGADIRYPLIPPPATSQMPSKVV
jgi:hypothetical protein